MAIYAKFDQSLYCVLIDEGKCSSMYLCLESMHFTLETFVRSKLIKVSRYMKIHNFSSSYYLNYVW